jgi:hypothetical protein
VSWILAGYRKIARSIKEEGKREADEELCAKETRANACKRNA